LNIIDIKKEESTNMNNREIELCETFNSFQGEYPDIGGIYTFVRFSNCNLRCPWCHYEDGTSTYYGNIKSLRNMSVDNLYLKTLDRTNTSVLYQNAKVLYKSYIEFDAYIEFIIEGNITLKVSYDHMLYVKTDKYGNGTWKHAVDIRTGDEVLNSINGWSRVINKQTKAEKITLTSIKTSTGTYIYNNILHHNCDTELSMKTKKIITNLSNIAENVFTTRGILFTGGEPSLYEEETKLILEYISEIIAKDESKSISRISVESNGTRINKYYSLVKSYVDIVSAIQSRQVLFYYTWSPKLFDDEHLRRSLRTLEDYFDVDVMKDVYIKIVHTEQDEGRIRNFLDTLVKKCDIDILNRTSLMPEGTDHKTILNNITKTYNLALKYGINISPRVHILSNFP
jgi:organic radical activating enzyme